MKHHMSLNIAGCLRLTRRRKINFLSDDSGRQLSDGEARLHLHNLQQLGHKLMDTSGECEGFDPMEHGCPGHEIIEE